MLIDIEKIIRENIERTIHLSLATVSGDKPWVCEVHFAYDADLNIYFRSLPSRRHSVELSLNSNVAGNIIDKFVVNESVQGVYFEGKASLIEESTDRVLAAKCLTRRLEITKDILEVSQDDEGTQFYKISVNNWHVFGDFDGKGEKKHSIEWDRS